MPEASKGVHSRPSGLQKHRLATEVPSLVASTALAAKATSWPAYVGMIPSYSSASPTSMITYPPSFMASPTSTVYVPAQETVGSDDDLMGAMLGMLGGITVLMTIIITLSSIKRTKRQEQRRYQLPESPTKSGWGVRESWYSDTLSTCPSTLPPPYYYDSAIYNNSTKKEPMPPILQPPIATLQYSSRAHALEQTAPELPLMTPTTTIKTKPAPRYSPQLAFSPSFNTAALVRKIGPNDIDGSPRPFQTHPQQQQLSSTVQPPSPSATKSTPHYSPQLVFSPSLYTGDLVRHVQPSSEQRPSLPSLPSPQVSESTPLSRITAAQDAPALKPSRSNIPSYQAQLNKDL